MKLDIKAAWKKPWVKWSIIGIGIVGVFLILRGRMSGGSSASAGPSGPSDAQVAANAQTQAANIAAREQQSQNAAQVAIARLQASSGLAQLKADYAGKLAQLKADYAGKLQLQHETDITQTALANVQLHGLTAQLDAQTAQQANASSTQLAALNAQLAAQMHQADLQAGVQNHEVGASSKSQNTSAWLGAAVSIGAIAASFF